MSTDHSMDNRHNYDPLWVALAMMWLGALAGLAAFLRTTKPDAKITLRAVGAAMLNSSLFCGAICVLMFHHFGNESILLTIGVSILAGLGGNSAIGFALQMLEFLAKRQTGMPDDDK